MSASVSTRMRRGAPDGTNQATRSANWGPSIDTNEEAWALAGQWGAARYMTPFEALMWRVEADPRLRSTMTVVYLLDSAPDWDRLVAAHEWAHLAGYADESEANFVGWLTCARASDAARYSGWT